MGVHQQQMATIAKLTDVLHARECRWERGFWFKAAVTKLHDMASGQLKGIVKRACEGIAITTQWPRKVFEVILI